MKRLSLALSTVGFAVLLNSTAAYAGGWHCGRGYYGGGSDTAAIVAASLFGTAALVNAFNPAPRYVAPPPPAVVYVPPPPPAVVYVPAPPPAYYPPPGAYYYPAPRPYYYRPY